MDALLDVGWPHRNADGARAIGMLLWLEPRDWMADVARIGLVLTLIGFAPGFFRNVWVLFHEFRHFRRGFIEQFDHDVAQFRNLVAWLASYPRDVIETQARYATMGYERLGNRLVMMLGGIERLGLLPLLLSLFVVLRNWRDLLASPPWLAFLAIMAAVLWGIGWTAAVFRRRLQLYVFLLDEALVEKEGEASPRPRRVLTRHLAATMRRLPMDAKKGAEAINFR